MARPKGQKKLGGRAKGTPNKVTIDLRSRVQMLIDNNFDTLNADLKSLQPQQRLQAISRLLEFVLPKGVILDVKGELTLKQFLELPISERQDKLNEIEFEENN